MSDYKKNIEAMAKSLALMLAGNIVLSDEDSLDIYSLSTISQCAIINKMSREYENKVEIDPREVRNSGHLIAYENAVLVEFDNAISDSCEQWIRRLQKDDHNE